MTERIPLDDLTSDQLDALYDRIATLEHVAAGNRRHVQYVVPELERAEAAIARVTAVRDQWQGRLLPSPAYELLTELRTALNEPTPVAGPAAAEPPVDRQTAVVLAPLHHSAETTVSRVIDLYERWVKAGPPPLGTSMARWWDMRLAELHNAIQPPEPTTPLVDRPFRTHRQPKEQP